MTKKKNSKKAEVDEVDVVDVESEKIEEIEAFVCPSCGAEVADDTIICPGCGAFFDFEDESEGEEAPLLTSDMEDDSPPLPPDPEELMDPPTMSEEEVPAPSEPDTLPAEEPAPYIVRENDVRVAGVLKEYSAKRRKRYLYGALSTGLGIIFFVLLWLVTVYQVMVVETDTLIAVDILLLLVLASVFFILGLYMILTYPKSSLMDAFATMPRAEQK